MPQNHSDPKHGISKVRESRARALDAGSRLAQADQSPSGSRGLLRSPSGEQIEWIHLSPVEAVLALLRASREVACFAVVGEPKPQPRPRVRRFGKGVYNPASADAFKAAIRRGSREAIAGPVEGAVVVVLTFVFARPKSHYRTGKFAGQIKAGKPDLHTTKPDNDNCLKAVLDAMNGVAFPDDASVVAPLPVKRYVQPGEDPHTRIQVLYIPTN